MSAPLPDSGRPVVCVQGIGFVGTAMALATASARAASGEPLFDVVGVEADTSGGRERADALRGGSLPVESADPRMGAALAGGLSAGNLTATTDPEVYSRAAVTVVDIGLDLGRTADGEPDVDFGALKAAVRTLGEQMPQGSLVMVETTVPPGACEKVIAPELDAALARRGLQPGAIHMAHAYERVMPGTQYLDSIVNFWRVYAGRDEAAADACERFLSAVVNVAEFPLTRLPSMAASEIGKLLENSYRATTIAFMEEWGRFAEAIDVDLFQVIAAIRRRPTHSNMRQPGFGVGGYCLTKDPLFAQYGAQKLFGLESLDFPFSSRSVATNEAMPLVSLDRMQQLLGGSLQGKRVLLLGVAYRQGVADTRFSPSGVFLDAAEARGAEVVAHDPLLTEWDGRGELSPDLPAATGFDAIIFAVPHPEYTGLDVLAWLEDARPLVMDANAVLDGNGLAVLAGAGVPVWSIGRGRPAA